jgi:sugar lactone lactonase YvrE
VTYFNAGVRVYDVADPEAPREVAFWVSEPAVGQPAAQANDLFVDADGLVWVTDRVGGGLFVLAPEPALEALMRDAEL